MSHLKAFLGLLVLIVLASPAAFAEDSSDKCKAFDEGAVEQVEEVLSDSERPLHDAAAKLARDFICKGSETCLEKHGARLAAAAHTIIDVCLEDPDVPKYMCLGLVANASNEGGMLEHPTCGGLDEKCVLRCDELPGGGARQACFVSCAIDQGISGERMKRVKACNDRGTSKGPYQMKPRRIRTCRKIIGPDFDPFNMKQAARCTLEKIKRTALNRKWPCRRDDGNRWMIAMKRVGAGPLETLSPAQKAQCVPNPRDWKAEVCVGAKSAVRVQQCNESGYAKRGLRYYRACGKKCSLVKYTPPDPKAEPVAEQPATKLSMQEK